MMRKTSLDVWAVSLIVVMALLMPVFGQEKNGDSLEADGIRVEEYIAFLGSLPEELVAFYYPDGIKDQIIATPVEDRIDYGRAPGVDREELMHGLTREQREGFDRWYHQSDPLMMFNSNVKLKYKGSPVNEYGKKEGDHTETDDRDYLNHIELSPYQKQEKESFNNSKADSDEHNSQNSVYETKKDQYNNEEIASLEGFLINAQERQSSSFQTQELVLLFNPEIINGLVSTIKMTERNYIKNECFIGHLLRYWEDYFKRTKAKYDVQSQSSNSLPSTISSSYTSTDPKLEHQLLLDDLNNINFLAECKKLQKRIEGILAREACLNKNIALIDEEIEDISDPLSFLYNPQKMEELLKTQQIFQYELEDISPEINALNEKFSLIDNGAVLDITLLCYSKITLFLQIFKDIAEGMF
jgi:hypothetical protein